MIRFTFGIPLLPIKVAVAIATERECLDAAQRERKRPSAAPCPEDGVRAKVEQYEL